MVYIHRLDLVLLDAKKNIIMEHKAVAGANGAEINSVDVLEGGAKFAVMESCICKILVLIVRIRCWIQFHYRICQITTSISATG